MFLHGFQIHRVPYWKLWKRTRDSRFWSILHVFVDKYKVLGWPKSSFETSITSYGLPWWLRCLPAMQETWVRFLGREYPLKKEMAIHSSTLAWKIPWTEEPDRLQSMGSQRVGHDWVTSLHNIVWKNPNELLGPPNAIVLTLLSITEKIVKEGAQSWKIKDLEPQTCRWHHPCGRK